MTAYCHNSRNPRAPCPTVVFSDEEMKKIHGNAERTAYIRVSGAKWDRFQLGSCIHRSRKLEGRVEVSEHGQNWYSAHFSTDRDYNLAIQSSNWQISDRCSIEVHKWQPDFQFDKVPRFSDGDIVEARVEGLPSEYWGNDAVTKIGNTVCHTLGSHVSGVETSTGKPPRFRFQLAGSSSCLDLPLQVQIAGSVSVGLTYSRAQQCYRCGRFGHIRRTCRHQLNQGFDNRSSTRLNAAPAQLHRPHLDREPVPIPEVPPAPPFFPEESGGASGSVGSSVNPLEHTIPARQEETSPMEPFSVIHYFASSSGDTSPPRPLQTTEMGVKGAMLFENGGESRPTLYNIAGEVSGIDVTVKVTHLNDQRGNRRLVNLTPRTGHAPCCSKRLLYTSIDASDIRSAVRQLKDTCDVNHVSMAVVLDKSAVLTNDDRIVRCFGFSASHSTEMTFRTFGPDGSALDVKGNCLLMWKREHVNVSPVLCCSTGLQSQHVQFSASWVVGSDDSSSAEQDSDDSSHGFSSGEEGSDFSNSTTSDEDNESPTYAPSEDTDSDESSFFSSSGEERSSESSVSSSSSNESSISSPNGDTNSEGSSLFFTASEEHSDESSAFSRSDLSYESSTISSNGDTD